MQSTIDEHKTGDGALGDDQGLKATSDQLVQQFRSNASTVKAIELLAPRLDRAVGQASASATRLEFEALSQGVTQQVTQAAQQSPAAVYQAVNALEACSREAKQVIEAMKSTQAGLRRDGWSFVLVWTVVGGVGALLLGYLMT